MNENFENGKAIMLSDFNIKKIFEKVYPQKGTN